MPELKPAKNYFAALAGAVIYQQLSGRAAAAIFRRFRQLFAGKHFPAPREVLALREAQFRAVGISIQKARYLRDLAQKFLNGTIKPRRFAKLSDETIKQELLAVRGIGPWTADMFLIFALNRPDVLPTEDLGIKKGFQKVFGLGRLPSAGVMARLAAPYRGRHTRLSLYLWQAVDNSVPVSDASRQRRRGEPW